MLRNLVYDLEKNTIPNKDIPDTWFQSFEIEKKKFKMMHKQRVELEKKREYLLEQVVSTALKIERIFLRKNTEFCERNVLTHVLPKFPGKIRISKV